MSKSKHKPERESGVFVSWGHGKITLRDPDGALRSTDVAVDHEVTLDGEPALSTDLKPDRCTVALTGDPATAVAATSREDTANKPE